MVQIVMIDVDGSGDNDGQMLMIDADGSGDNDGQMAKIDGSGDNDRLLVMVPEIMMGRW